MVLGPPKFTGGTYSDPCSPAAIFAFLELDTGNGKVSAKVSAWPKSTYRS